MHAILGPSPAPSCGPSDGAALILSRCRRSHPRWHRRMRRRFLEEENRQERSGRKYADKRDTWLVGGVGGWRVGEGPHLGRNTGFWERCSRSSGDAESEFRYRLT
ncbi:hypothetical protein EYF80_030970 [Liparis tanakae]|uniref:Uncharacterized protein n=1 Tax=Liparis tanakae TaxID=230148 RepID=A0A4Z2GZR6_9TELE|nr:hypothetical protein EYF80_030970 [Liparis tanakae]